MLRRYKKKLIALAVLIVLPIVAHFAIAVATPIRPPAIEQATGEPVASPSDPDLRVIDSSYARHRGGILEVRLGGSPERIGHDHARLLYREMVANEGALYSDFAQHVPTPMLRWLIMDVSRVEFRGVDRGMTEPRRREIAAEALGFSPDPYDSFLPTYHRFVFLQSLYDIALSFEHSPLLGCTSFALRGDAFEGGHVVLARNFDFEAGSIFDTGKAVFIVHEADAIPYASVAWPGLVGAVSGMNAEGLALVVHGARGKKPANKGEPVVHTMRDVLAGAKTTADAIRMLEARDAMVSHIVMLADASGDVAIVERAPGERPFVRRPTGDKVPLTNHFEGPLASDPANERVRASTSTLPRRARLDELLANLPAGASVERAVATLRDKSGTGDKALPLGDRRTLDALIATHGVVMDATARKIWVSEGPHLAGRFIAFDLKKLFDAGFVPNSADPIEAIDADPIYTDGRYDAWVKAGSHHSSDGEKKP